MISNLAREILTPMIDRASASSPVRSPSTKNAEKTDPTVPLGRVPTSRAATESVQDGARLLDKSWEVIQRKSILFSHSFY